MLADVFKNFRNMCLEICQFDAAHFFAEPGLALKIDLSTDIEKGIRGGICHVTDMQKLIINKWKIMIEINNQLKVY